MKDEHNRLSRTFLFVGYAIAGLCLFLFSYTQVDLNLTLSRVSLWQTIQKTFQHIGYYERPFATGVYGGILLLLFTLYIYTLRLISQNILSRKHLFLLVLALGIFLPFSYPAFSYDIFNHMFTAKTVLIYHINPYLVTPLQFIGIDPWLTFMRWTHVVSIYSPLWIGLTLVPYLLGFGYFLLILWNFKLVIAAFYLLAVYAIANIMKHRGEKDECMSVAIFALNPLVLIEALVGSHNDMVMMGCAVFGYYLFIKRRFVWAFMLYAFSIAFKLVTIVLLPSVFFPKKRWVPLVLMTISLLGFLFVTKREVMPWYFLWIMPFAALFPGSYPLLSLIIGVSLGLLLRYAPYFYFGNWDGIVPMMKEWFTWIPIGISFLIACYFLVKKRRRVAVL